MNNKYQYKKCITTECLLQAQREFKKGNFTSAKIWTMSAQEHLAWLEENSNEE